MVTERKFSTAQSTDLIKLLKYFILTFICWQSIGQSARTPVKDAFRSYAENNFYEKIYVQLDQEYHLTGEVLWFKIYYVDATFHKPLDLSKVAYVEILDQNNTAVLQTKVALQNGAGAGSIFIPAKLPTATYIMRVYTNWMKNFAPEFYFHKQIFLINTLKANEPKAEVSSNSLGSVEVQFFPEGGYLVEGISSRVGFRILNNLGKGDNCQGAVLNQSNDTIAKFKPLRFGIGSFQFTPQSGEHYRVVILSNFYKTQATIPEILKSGYVLSVSEGANETINIKVSNGDPTIAVQLFIHTRQSIKAAEVKSSTEGTVEFQINKKIIGEGVSHITIFDLNNNPVCERLYFKRPNSLNDLVVGTDQTSYSTRRKAQVHIEAKALGSNLSMTVFRADSTSSSENIISNLFLTSDLAGAVENPWFYFSDDPTAVIAADNLMLTQGWRRFNWAFVNAKKLPLVHYLPEIEDHLICGKMSDKTGKPLVDHTGYLASPGSKIILYVAKSDSAGRLTFRARHLQKNGKIIAVPDINLDSTAQIEIESPFSKEAITWQAHDLNFTKAMEKGLTQRSMAMQVQDIYYEDSTYFRFKKIQSDTMPFYGKADEVYNLDDYTRFPVMEEILREYVKGVWVRKNKGQFRFMVMDEEKKGIFNENPLILLDGVPIFDINQVMSIDPLRIKKLEVMTRKYTLGQLAFSGILSYSTYNGDLEGFQLDPRYIVLDYEGLQHQREFYSPKYLSPTARANRLPDQRHLLYWNPNIMLNNTTSTKVLDFYTSDVEGTFFIIVEGVSPEGIPGYATATFLVSH